MKKIILFLTVTAAFFLTQNLSAQMDYSSAIGARLGYPLSISFKKAVGDNKAVEVTGGTRGYRNYFGSSGYRWYQVGAAYLIHKPLNIDGLEDLNWYFGGGGSVYFWTWDDGLRDSDFSTTSFGIQGYIGLEYTFDDIPLNLTLDWVPTLFLNGFGSGFGAGYGSLGVRYVLARQ